MSDVPTAPPPTPNAGRQSADVAERTKRGIVEAALAAFAEHGYEGASLRDIARRAGTTHGLIRHHFGSKDDIFRAVVDHSVEVYETAYAPVHAAIRRGEHRRDPVGVLEGSLRRFAETSARHPEMMRLLMHEGSHDTPRLRWLFERIAVLDDLYEDLFETARAEGLLRPFDCDSYFLFVVCNLGLPFGLTAFASGHVGGDILAEEQVERQLARVRALLFPER